VHCRAQARLDIAVRGRAVAQPLVRMRQTQHGGVVEVTTDHHHADRQLRLVAAEASVDGQSWVASRVHWKRVVRVARILVQVFYVHSYSTPVSTAAFIQTCCDWVLIKTIK